MGIAPRFSLQGVVRAALIGAGVVSVANLGLAAVAQQVEYVDLRARAERDYAEGSYRRANELYLQARDLELDDAERQWVAFRLGDSAWRAAATSGGDRSAIRAGRQQLQDLIREIGREPVNSSLWAEAHESLGDFWWHSNNGYRWQQAWKHYAPALDWWAGSEQLDAARERYLGMVWKIAGSLAEGGYLSFEEAPPFKILDNAAAIATDDADRARAHLLAAMMLSRHGETLEKQQRVAPEFEGALALSAASEWHDDVLYQFGMWLAEPGQEASRGDQKWRHPADRVRSVELLRTLTTQYAKGETPHYDDAVRQIRATLREYVDVTTSNVFVPGSEIEVQLGWRNVANVDLKLYAIELHRSPDFSGRATSSRRRLAYSPPPEWLSTIDLAQLQPLRSWSVSTDDDGVHEPGQRLIRIGEKLPLGAYVIEATQADVGTRVPWRGRELVLVSDASLVLKRSGNQALVYFCDAFSGAPLAGASVTLWEHNNPNVAAPLRPGSTRHTAITGDDGIAVVELRGPHQVFVAAAREERQAFVAGFGTRTRPDRGDWRVYAHTDRAAYRPGDKAHWKLIARRYDGSEYSTPANETLWYEIYDARGAKVAGERVELNAFGSAWGELALSKKMPLGVYRVSFKNEESGREIGSATLLRLEEYKLPEFKVAIETPSQEDGRKKTFRPGETVEATISAEYYSGGAVGDATVEVVVYQSLFRHTWRPRREYGWYYDDIDRVYSGFGQRQVIERQTLSANAAGVATLAFKPPPSSEQDFEYRIEARVIDASRREIVASDTVRVTRQRTFVYARPRHHLVRPEDTVRIDFNALDANQQGLKVSGTVTVTRDTWSEVWVSPSGTLASGTSLETLRRKHPSFPRVGDQLWSLKFRGYEHEEIVTAPVSTDEAGEAEFDFTPHRDGYYVFAFAGREDDDTSILASSAVWVASNQSAELGFRRGALGIIVDRDTFRVGETAAVMLTTPDSDRYVLFSVAGDDLYRVELVHVTGTAKLMHVELEEKHVPNIYVGGTMVAERGIYEVTKQVVVPPADNFLDVQLQADAEQHRPGEKGALTVRVRDQEGRPVVAEVALGLVDEATFYIQDEYAADPRQFFFGDKRGNLVATTSSFHAKRYVDLVEMGDGELLDRRDQLRRARGQSVGNAGGIWTYDGAETSDMSAAGASSMYYDFDSFSEGGVGTVRVTGRAPAVVVKRYSPPAPQAAADQAAVEPAVQVRSDFRATAFWQPDVVTGADGTATVNITYPESLTRWRATARVASATNQFGVATTSARTDKPLIVRLQAPRFFVVGDTATVSAVINNNTDEAVTVATALAAEGLRIVGAGTSNTLDVAPTLIPPGGDGRVDWTVRATDPGSVRLVVTGRSPENSDAMERRLVAHDHGLEKLVAVAGKMRGDEVGIRLNIPAARQLESTRLAVQLTPSVAVTMLDALPYLIDYPYGCTEQTLSRFLPAVITARTLGDLGLAPEEVTGRVFGGIEPRYAAGPGAAQRSDLQQLDDVVESSLARLYDFQHDDGGWGWWAGGESDHYMTAYAVWGLALARDAGIVVKVEVLERGVGFLGPELVESQGQPDLQAWMLHALAVYADVQQRQPGAGDSTRRAQPDALRVAAQEQVRFERARTRAFDNLWQRRDQLNAYSRALLALSAHHLGMREQALVLVRNLENGVVRDERPDVSILQPAISGTSAAPLSTAHWGQGGGWWRWSDGGVEATSFALRALLAIDPGNVLIEPATNWLIKNRRGAQWSNTRDTSIAVLALNDYLEASGELQTDIEYELQVNGTSVARRRVAGDEILRAPSRFVIDSELIVDGENDIRIVRHAGSGPLYFAAQATFVSREEPIAAAGNEIFVKRQYNRLIGHKTLLKGYTYDRQPLHEGDSVTSGERLEVVIRIDAKNDYEYLMFEDLKPAGLEAVAVRSGGSLTARELESGALRNASATVTGDRLNAAGRGNYTGRSRWVYQELRDRKVALFVDKLPQGLWEIRYQVRAEVPGEFHALPLVGQAMYVPEIRANGQEQRLTVVDRPPRR